MTMAMADQAHGLDPMVHYGSNAGGKLEEYFVVMTSGTVLSPDSADSHKFRFELYTLSVPIMSYN
jgi:hypothetical protein